MAESTTTMKIIIGLRFVLGVAIWSILWPVLLPLWALGYCVEKLPNNRSDKRLSSWNPPVKGQVNG